MIGEVFATNVVQERWGGEGGILGDWLALAENGLVPVDDPYGDVHMVSLAPFDGADPNHYLLLSFIELREDRENFDHIDHGNAVVLKDYEIPDAESPAVTRPDLGDGTLLKKYALPPGVKMIE
jgi:hypothetical protein